ncbi:glutathione S-transferase family protein [Roseovarius nanhaiticus]|uniref:glutathione S-transferase family protein n=1 Tax=Roseovarius nanhaiticus TaxID=573024 RepID=UPI002490AEBD|nr:glutathione S-transferase family protein [Roseovarius nanhaiticus]
MSLILHYAPDNASLIVRLALEELGLPYQTRLVDRAARAQEGAAYRAINPHGLIPAIETPHGALFETAAILLWLDEQKPGQLSPMPCAQGRGDHLKWLLFIANTLHPALRMTFYPEKYCPGSEAALRAHMRGQILQYLARIEAAARGPFFAGDAPGMIDLYLAPLLRWCALYPGGADGALDLAPFPALLAMCRTLERRPAAQRAALAEGLGAAPYSAPRPPNPPEGSAT